MLAFEICIANLGIEDEHSDVNEGWEKGSQGPIMPYSVWMEGLDVFLLASGILSNYYNREAKSWVRNLALEDILCFIEVITIDFTVFSMFKGV